MFACQPTCKLQVAYVTRIAFEKVKRVKCMHTVICEDDAVYHKLCKSSFSNSAVYNKRYCSTIMTPDSVRNIVALFVILNTINFLWSYTAHHGALLPPNYLQPRAYVSFPPKNAFFS